VYGTGIIYSQNYLIPALGVKGAFSLTKALSMSASFILSPYLWCFDKDSHLFRQLDFYSSMHSGLLLEPRLSASYRFSPATAISLDVVYRHIAQLIGDTYEVGTGASGYTQISQLAPGQQSVTFTNGAGASLDVLNVTVSVDLGL
jgi:outer membrane protease